MIRHFGEPGSGGGGGTGGNGLTLADINNAVASQLSGKVDETDFNTLQTMLTQDVQTSQTGTVEIRDGRFEFIPN